jgi:hypothetical protein
MTKTGFHETSTLMRSESRTENATDVALIIKFLEYVERTCDFAVNVNRILISTS